MRLARIKIVGYNAYVLETNISIEEDGYYKLPTITFIKNKAPKHLYENAVDYVKKLNEEVKEEMFTLEEVEDD